MADVRALLAAEKSSRRIAHHHASYAKSGVLTCTACDLTIRSEALWEGHLKSTNHRKNAARIAAGQINREYHIASGTTASSAVASASGTKKRKIEDVDGHDALQEEQNYEVDGRKKPKSRAVSAVRGTGLQTNDPVTAGQQITAAVRTEKSGNGKHVKFSTEEQEQTEIKSPKPDVDRASEDSNILPDRSSHTPIQTQLPVQTQSQSHSESEAQATTNAQADIDEDEWAAFESDITTLATQQAEAQAQSSAATITAAPVTADEIRAQGALEETQRKKLRDTEIEDEQEDEGRRLEEEFEVMEEMEEKIRRLKEKRESLRVPLNLALAKEAIEDDGGGVGSKGHDNGNHRSAEAVDQTHVVNGQANVDDEVDSIQERKQDQNDDNKDGDGDGDGDDDDDDDDDDIDDWYS